MTQETPGTAPLRPAATEETPQTAPASLSRYLEAGYFECDTLLHPELPYRPEGFSGTPMPYRLAGDNWLTAGLLACSILFIILVCGIHRRLPNMTKAFFFPSGNSYAEEVALSRVGTLHTLGFALVLCLCGGLYAYMYMHAPDIRHAACGLSACACIGMYAAAIGAYLAFKTAMYGFVNRVFFDRRKDDEWRRANSYIITMETLAFVPLTVFTLYLHIPPAVSLAVFTTAFATARMLLFYRTFRIFCDADFGILQFFLYLCSLEAVPLLVLLKVLTLATIYPTVKI